MEWVYGIHAVEAMLDESPEEIRELWFVKAPRPGAARERIRSRASELGLRFKMVSEAELQRELGNVAHQGVALQARDYRYAEPSALLAPEGPQAIVVLDEVQDPHNLGAVVRTAAGLGLAGVVIPRHRAAGMTATARKVAVGAEQRVPIAQVTNIARFLDQAREAGFWIYGLDAEGEAALQSTDFAERSVLVMGSEDRGLRPNVRSHCDMLVRIPLGDLESLNVSVATGIAAWEWRRKRVP